MGRVGAILRAIDAMHMMVARKPAATIGGTGLYRPCQGAQGERPDDEHAVHAASSPKNPFWGRAAP